MRCKFVARTLDGKLEERRVEVYVNLYDMWRTYGGPEEGGWWYDQYCPSDEFVVDVECKIDKLFEGDDTVYTECAFHPPEDGYFDREPIIGSIFVSFDGTMAEVGPKLVQLDTLVTDYVKALEPTFGLDGYKFRIFLEDVPAEPPKVPRYS